MKHISYWFLYACALLSSTLYAQTPIAPYKFPDNVLVYGLGEATHGSREFMQNKTAIILDLIKHKGLKRISFEMPFIDGYVLNQYIKPGGKVTREAALKQGGWMFDVIEFGVLLDSLKNINDRNKENDPVSIFGFDSQVSSMQAREVIYALIPNAIGDSTLSKMLDDFKKTNVFMIDSAGAAACKIRLDEIKRYVKPMIFKNDVSQVELFFDMAWADLDIRLHYRDTINPGLVIRERYNAQNIIRFQGSRDSRVAVWAHNYHIAKKHDYGVTMGQLLKDHYEEKYFSLGYAFKLGNFLAWSPDNTLKSRFVESPEDYYPATLSWSSKVIHQGKKNLPKRALKFVEVGSGFANIESSTIIFTPYVSFDGMILFEKVNSPRPNYPLSKD